MKPVAIVTGASRGIGRAIATELAGTHQVIATYRGRKDAAESLQAETGCDIFQCDLLETSEESFDELIGTNLKGPHFLTQGVAKWMAEHKAGRIVFVTSISSYTASVNRGEYCISKAGLSMTVALYALRLAELGIKVFEIRPGIIRTDMIAKVEKLYDDKIAAGLLPQRRMGEGSDVAKAVRAIADGLLDYSTGQILNVDGGFSLRSL